jgi:Domain of unknown function (DUF4404)
MDRETVRARLAQIHDELAEAHESNPETRAHLGGVLPDVKRLADGGTQDDSLKERLERVAVQFEANHPAVAGSVRRLVDLLGEVGI